MNTVTTSNKKTTQFTREELAEINFSLEQRRDDLKHQIESVNGQECSYERDWLQDVQSALVKIEAMQEESK